MIKDKYNISRQTMVFNFDEKKLIEVIIWL